MNDQTENFKPSWKIRRRIILSTLLFCGFCVIYILIWGADTRINESIILGCFSLTGAIIGSYVFGAVWETNTERKHVINGSRNNNTYIGGRHTTTNASPSTDRRQKAKERLERMRSKRKVDNPDG